jgi:hypothetical protein
MRRPEVRSSYALEGVWIIYESPSTSPPDCLHVKSQSFYGRAIRSPRISYEPSFVHLTPESIVSQWE